MDVQKEQAVSKQPVNTAVIAGRIEEFRRSEEFFYTVIATPAADAYSHPAVIEVRSSRSLGRKGDQIEVSVRISGFRGRSFQYKDKETGEIARARPVNNSFIAVE